MSAQDPTYAKSHDASAWDAADGAAQTDFLTCGTDNNTSTSCVKQGKSPDDVVRLEYANLINKSVGDTISVYFGMTHNYGTMALVPYDGATSVLTTNKLTYVISGGSPAVFTLTQAWMDDLHDLGSGKGACRFVEDGEINGDIEITEVDADLVDAAGNDQIAATEPGLTVTESAAIAAIGTLAEAGEGITFGQSAAVIGKGPLTATEGVIFSESADLGVNGAVSATDGVTFGKSASIVAQGLLAGTDGITFGQSTAITARGLLEATDGIIFSESAAIIDAATGNDLITATDGITFSKSAAIGAKGLLESTNGVTFGQSTNAVAQGLLEATDGIVFTQSAVLSGEAVAAEVFSGGYPDVYKYRPRVRFKFKDEEEKKAARIIEEIIEYVPEDTTQQDLELDLRIKLKTQGLLYKALYLTWIIEENRKRQEQEYLAKRLKRRREEEEIILIMMH